MHNYQLGRSISTQYLNVKLSQMFVNLGYLQRLSAHIVNIPTFQVPVPPYPGLSVLLSIPVHRQYPSGELIPNLVIPCHYNGRPYYSHFCYFYLLLLSQCHRCCIQSIHHRRPHKRGDNKPLTFSGSLLSHCTPVMCTRPLHPV